MSQLSHAVKYLSQFITIPKFNWNGVTLFPHKHLYFHPQDKCSSSFLHIGCGIFYRHRRTSKCSNEARAIPLISVHYTNVKKDFISLSEAGRFLTASAGSVSQLIKTKVLSKATKLKKF